MLARQAPRGVFRSPPGDLWAGIAFFALVVLVLMFA